MNFHRLGGITALAGCSTSDALSSDIHRIPINRPAQIIQCHHYLRGDADKTAFVERQQEFAALQRGQPVGDHDGRAPLIRRSMASMMAVNVTAPERITLEWRPR